MEQDKEKRTPFNGSVISLDTKANMATDMLKFVVKQRVSPVELGYKVKNLRLTKKKKENTKKKKEVKTTKHSYHTKIREKYKKKKNASEKFGKKLRETVHR